MRRQASEGNQVTLLESGAAFFPALIAAIDGARAEVHLETYIFADDLTGREVATALMRAVARGVTVRVLVDGFGADNFDGDLARDLRASGVKVLVYRPQRSSIFVPSHWRRSHLRRMHRKLAVMDGQVAFIGGINIVDDWDDLNHRAQTPPRFDYAVELSGPLVAQIHQAVRKLWLIVSWSQVGRRPLRRPEPLPPVTVSVVAAGPITCAFLVRDNVRHRRDIEAAYLEAIEAARREILIANAYFLPGRQFLRSLIDAARRGVRVTLLLQGKVEYWVQHQATQSLYQRLLAEGIVIHEYRRSFLHAKVAVIDGQWATVGSSNIDPFSLLLAREANVLVLDAGFANRLRESLDAAIASGAQRVDDTALQHRSLWQRLQGRIAYLLVRLAAAWSRHGGGAEY